VASLYAGLAVLAVALVSPLDALSAALFSAHMVQHLLLLVVAPPLLVLGIPPVAMFWALPGPSRRSLGRWWNHSRALRCTWRVLSHPLSAWMLATASLWLWHMPALFDAALRNDALHALEHLSFVSTALLVWWLVLQPRGRRRLGYAGALAVVVTAALQSAALGALLTFAHSAWYAPSGVEGSWGLSVLQDQQIAGLLMWVPGGAAYAAALCAVVVLWLRDAERGQRRRDASPHPRRSLPSI
jgi:cytochrome c oxidase assembly factor CtaG